MRDLLSAQTMAETKATPSEVTPAPRTTQSTTELPISSFQKRFVIVLIGLSPDLKQHWTVQHDPIWNLSGPNGAEMRYLGFNFMVIRMYLDLVEARGYC